MRNVSHCYTMYIVQPPRISFTLVPFLFHFGLVSKQNIQIPIQIPPPKQKRAEGKWLKFQCGLVEFSYDFVPWRSLKVIWRHMFWNTRDSPEMGCQTGLVRRPNLTTITAKGFLTCLLNTQSLVSSFLHGNNLNKKLAPSWLNRAKRVLKCSWEYM